VLRRGSLRAAEALVHDLELTEVEVDEFWSSVRRKGGCRNGRRVAGRSDGARRSA
jgi:hypothetical protein